MNKKNIFVLMIFTIIFVIPLLSADCPPGAPPGSICGGGGIEITIQTGMFCTDDGENWIDYSGGVPLNFPTIGLGNCYQSTAVGSKFCCPAGSICEFQGQSGLYNCVYTDENFCWKLDNEASCNNYTKWIAEDSIEAHKGEGYCGADDTTILYVGGEWCWDEIDCSCQWDNVNNNCTAIDNSTRQCENTMTQLGNEGICNYTMDTWQDNCDLDGFIYASWTVNGTGIYAAGGNGCVDTTVTPIPCEKIVKLDFFTWLNVIVVILILVLIYYSYIKVKKEKK